jgi:opacity protein-like surface antigen
MSILGSRCIVLVALAAVTGTACARSDAPWDGLSFGVNAGEASSSTCNSRALTGAMIDASIASEFYNRECSKNGALIGGVQIGENFQFKRLLLGVGADVDYWNAKSLNQSLNYTGAVPPPGTYAFSGKLGPAGFAVIGPRIGYAGDTWLPYLRMGGILTAGSHNGTFYYTPAGATKPAASFSGGKDFATSGWVAGGGFELGLNGAWSIMAEYLHANLGKGSNSTTTCSGPAAACAAFSGISFGNNHEGFSANLFRIGVTYWFGYWQQ